MRGARNKRAHPWPDITAIRWRERIFRDVKRALRFKIGAAKSPRAVQSPRLQFGEIRGVVEIHIQNRAIMFTRRNDDRRLPAKQKIVRIIRVQSQRSATDQTRRCD